ncbi:MAG: Stk1 family PASTA domain-containing Ser/Thr kinase [Dermatophilaceae bacterium]
MTVDPTDPLIGTLLDGRYRVEERIARGGMASVYRGVDTRLDREVALKVMRAHLAGDDTFVNRFRREARAAARLSHPNVVAVFDQGEDTGMVFLAMEYVPGRTLREVLAAEGALTPRAALDIMDPVLDALSAAHQAGLMHRDIKPENVIVRDDGLVKVADFGLARAVTSETATSAATEVMGTLSYISPEQIEHNDVTKRSDVYSAGLVLWEMLTGQKAFTGDSIPNVLFQHLHRGVPRLAEMLPDVPPSLDTLLGQATAKDPLERPADATEFRDELRHVRARLSDASLDGRMPAAPAAAAALAGQTVPLPSGSAAPDARADTAVLDVPAPIRPTPRRTAPAPAPATTPATTPGAGTPGGRERHTAPPLPPKRSRRGLLAVLAMMLLAFAGGAAAWWFLLGPGATTTVPTVVKLSQDAAVSALDKAHLDAHVTTVFSESVAKGTVIDSDPTAGTSAHRGDTVTLQVSKGLERYDVPALQNKSQAQAKTALEKVHLVLGTVGEGYDETVPEGKVVSSDPVAGTPMKRGQPVSVVLSLGPKPIDVPDLTGKTVEEATSILGGLGLTLDQGDDVFSLDVPKGQIAEQEPAGGTLQRDGTVTVHVSKGPEMVDVPDVYLKSQAEATAILEGLGFKVKANLILGAPLDKVTGQTPTGGQQAPKGSTVEITVV